MAFSILIHSEMFRSKSRLALGHLIATYYVRHPGQTLGS